jgi:hypothetical protein
MHTPAFFISPKGQVIDTEINHIATIVANPKKFGLTKDYIQAVYDKHGEKMNTEGKAREEIILRLIKQGWMRIRRYKNFWSINVNRFNGKVKAELQMWAHNLIQGKIPSYKEQDVYMDVRIDDGMKVSTSKIKVMAQGGLREANEKIVDAKFDLVNVEDLEDLEPYDFVKEELEKCQK